VCGGLSLSEAVKDLIPFVLPALLSSPQILSEDARLKEGKNVFTNHRGGLLGGAEDHQVGAGAVDVVLPDAVPRKAVLPWGLNVRWRTRLCCSALADKPVVI
jgi:hypothetical protein